MPSEAASLQPSSRVVSRANPPLVTHCFKRPFFIVGAGVCANAAEAAKAGMKSLRRMKHEYHIASAKRKVTRGGKAVNRKTFRLSPVLEAGNRRDKPA